MGADAGNKILQMSIILCLGDKLVCGCLETSEAYQEFLGNVLLKI
jgi:hypothetical protein